MADLMRWDVINQLIEKNNYRNYLEIGYYKGWSFDQIKLPYGKIAVDPNPSKNSYQESLEYGKVDHEWSCDEAGEPALNYDYKIIKVTSDDFFGKITGDKKWDIILIDGLHEAEQVYRDIQNSLAHLSEGGTIVLHDMLPPTQEHVTTGDKHGNWNGDCYKAILKLQREDILGNYKYYTVDTDWGVGILTKNIIPSERTDWQAKQVKYDIAIQNWSSFHEHKKELMNIISPEEFLLSLRNTYIAGIDPYKTDKNTIGKMEVFKKEPDSSTLTTNKSTPPELLAYYTGRTKQHPYLPKDDNK
jgi:hypothetical protein